MSISAINFYITGGTLQRDARCYVERQTDKDLLYNLKDGKFCYILTARQMGKSSLMVRTAARFREEAISVAVLDLTAIGMNLTAEQWYDGLLGKMAQQLGLEKEWESFGCEQKGLSPLLQWSRAIEEIVLRRREGRVVIFVEEKETV